MKIVSFDIFDTCLVRKCGSADAVYSILGDKLFPYDFTKAREFDTKRHFFAETAARVKFKTNYPSLFQIYSCINLQYLSKAAEELCKTEEDLEENLLIGVYKIRELIKNYRKKGYTIVFISDMYHSSNFLRKILMREGMMNSGDFLFVSCECNASKHHGDLYEYVKRKLKIKHWVHYGDNQYSDIKMALRQGLRPKKISHKYNRYEEKWLENETYTSAKALAAGCSKAFRLSNEKLTSKTLAIDVIAAMYIPFVYWVLKQAKLNGITKLLFFARDSFLFYQIAKVLETKMHTEIPLVYFYVSRKSLYLPSLYNCRMSDFQECDEDCLELSWNKFLNKFNLTSFQQKFNSPQEALSDSNFLLYAQQKSLQARKIFIDYLTQEGVSICDKVGIVDLGWLGSGRKVLSKIFTNEGYCQPMTYYFGVEKDRILSLYAPYQSYKYLEHHSKIHNLPSPLIFEHYFSITSDNSTIGYKKENDKVVPVFAEGEIADWQKNLFEINKNVIVQYTKELLYMVESRHLPYLSNLGEESWKLLKESPCYSDYILFKDIKVEHFGSQHFLAPKISILEFLYLKIRDNANYIYWPEMSLAGHKILGQFYLYIYHKLKSII